MDAKGIVDDYVNKMNQAKQAFVKEYAELYNTERGAKIVGEHLASETYAKWEELILFMLSTRIRALNFNGNYHQEQAAKQAALFLTYLLCQ